MLAMAALSLTLPSISSSSQSHSLPTFRYNHHQSYSFFTNGTHFTKLTTTTHRPILSFVPSVGNEDAELRVSSTQQIDDDDVDDDDDDDIDEEPTPQDLEYVAQIKRVSLLFLENLFIYFISFPNEFLCPLSGFGAS
jgi:hypothetical protein